MWLSPDSFLAHACAFHCDSACFFEAGKAWMEGMVPYVDFADSKGPLLWLIYGVGYLISPTSYVGVFWLSVFAYSLTFIFVWRTARLFVGWRESVFVLCAMPAFLFFSMFHNEIRAEDFCMPWLCIGIYCTCRVLLSSTEKTIRKCAFVLGASMSCCLLIKWNIFLLMGGMALVILTASLRRKSWGGIVFGLLGIVVVCLPFIVYFLWQGNFTNMLQEYFLTTFLITGRGTDPVVWHNAVHNMLTDRSTIYRNIVLIGAILGIILFCRRFKMSRWLVLSYLPIFLFLILEPLQSYYFTIVMPFYVYFLVFLAQKISSIVCKMKGVSLTVIAVIIYFVGIVYNLNKDNLIFFPSPEQERWDEIHSVLRTKQVPHVIFAGLCGYGIQVRALPACKYWALQNNPTSEMIAERHRAIRDGKADFVVVTRMDIEKVDSLFYKVLAESGYRQCNVMVVKDGKTVTKALPVYAR